LTYGESANPEFREHITPLNQDIVRTWDRYGGTFLGTSRLSPYDPKNDQSKVVIDNIEQLGLEAVIAIGGDGTLAIACRLAQEGVNVIGIPKTIEVETMGRSAGWLALEGGESCGAFIILIPEHDFSIEKVNELVVEGRRAGARYEIIVVAEGAKPVGYSEFVKEEGVDSFGHKALGGIAEFLAKEIRNSTKLESRSVVLSHLQRGGAPCAYDRRMGRYFGIAAVDLIVKKDFGKMVCYKNGKITSCPLEEIMGKLNLVNIETQYDTERYNGRRTIINM